MEKFKLWVVCMMFLPSLVLCWSYLAVTEKTDESNSKEGENFFNDVEIYEMLIDAKISNRFARTFVTSKVLNPSDTAKETTFSVLLPDRAFISEFIMIIDGKSYKAYVKEKNEAKQIYDQAIVMGMGAAHVEASARDSNRFTVSVNIEPQKKVIFQLTYEELLSRREGKYEMIINIHPKQPIENLYVNVMINESRPLTFVTAPPLRTGNEIFSYRDDLDPRAQIAILNSTSAIVHFSPDIDRQKELAKIFGTDVNEGLSAQFVVQYDVERDPNGGEVLIRDGYFVHFFAPKNMEPLNKFILFVLDTSGSMWNGKLKQLKDAMSTILDQLDKNDLFYIISFGSSTKTWDINNPGASVESPSYDHWFTRNENDTRIFEERYPSAFTATIDNVQNAKNIVSRLNAYGGTNIYEALRIALHLVKMETRIFDYVEYDSRLPMIMFLTDGDATTGITSKEKIIKDISKHNTQKIPIYSLSFGSSSDRNFLKKLSLQNMAFSRHIYADSDAALQLENFYKQISTPLLSDVKFNYVPEATSLTETNFPVHFKESEIVVAGKVDSTVFPGIPMVMCRSKSGYVSLPSVVEHPVTSLERLWAYLTIQQLLDKRELVENKTAIEREALNLALKYSFVTKISSLVVVKPNGSESEEDTVVDLKTPTTRVPQINKNRFHSRPRYMVDNLRTPFTRVSQINNNYRAVSKKFRLQLPQSLISSRMDIDLMIKVNKLDSLKHALPWLSKIINDDETIKTPTGLSGDQFHFDSNGDGPARYNIIHFKQVDNGKYHWVRVGEYMEGVLRLNMSELQFKRGHPKPPESVCSLPCDLGQAKKYVEGESCCWHCFNCTQYQIRNAHDETQCVMCKQGTIPDPLHIRCLDIPEEYLRPDSGWAIGAMALSSTGVLITMFVCGVFIRHNDTPVVRASGRELSYVLLTGIFMCYCVTYALVLRPNDIVCGIQRFGAGFCFTVVYAALLTKTNRISRIFNAGKRSAKRPSFISPRSQLIICSGLVGVQVLINGVWMIISPARAIHHYPTRYDNLLVCSSYIDASYMIAFSYPIFLIVVCTVYAVLTRKIPEAFNESKHIGFTMYTTCVIWLAFVPLYFGTANHVALRITSMSVTISLSASVTVACLFSPKLYIILIRPERNVRQSMMPMRYSAISKNTGTAGSGSMMATVMVTAATCNQKQQIQKHVPPIENDKEAHNVKLKLPVKDCSTQTIPITRSNSTLNSSQEHLQKINNCNVGNGPLAILPGVQIKDIPL